MSMDDGAPSISNYELKARLRAAIDIEGVPFGTLCRQAGVSERQVVDALSHDPPRLMEYRHVLEPICYHLGRNFSWLVSGNDSRGPHFRESLLEKVVCLVWEYVYKMAMPLVEGRELVAYAKRRVKNLQCNTAHAAYRTGIPRTWRDVALMHQSMQRRR